jgi:hypothetical protein
LALADRLFPERSEPYLKEERPYLCPVCGFDYVHFGDPHVTDADYSLTRYTTVRGPELQIPMWCEERHTWVLIYGFHKGRIFVNEAITPGAEHPWDEAVA